MSIRLRIILISAYLLLFSMSGCKAPDPLSGIGNALPGSFTNLENGVLYLPPQWKIDDTDKWHVYVVLHGYGELSRSLSGRPFWEELAAEYGIVLFFVETGHNGWDERRDSKDSKLINSILKAFRKQMWIARDGIGLFGWSAGAIMTMGYAAVNTRQEDGRPLFDRLVAYSGGFGLIMEKELRTNPALSGSVPVPAFVCWGEAEESDHGKDAADSLRKLGWPVETATHPGGHVLVESLVREAFIRNRTPGIEDQRRGRGDRRGRKKDRINRIYWIRKRNT